MSDVGTNGSTLVPGTLWITWERHRRTRETARRLGIPVEEVLPTRTGPFKYPGLVARTLSTLRRERPHTLLVQCPSIILGALAVLARRWFGYRLVADLHNEAVRPLVVQAGWYVTLVRLIQRRADVSIVTNDGLVETITGNGGRAFVLPDPVPAWTTAGVTSPRDVVFVCTYSPDEPWQAVIEAATMLPAGVNVHITGRAPEAALAMTLPVNVRLTGFLSHEDYDALLARAAVIMDLTSMDDCLVCGAYEAVAAGVPLVTSDTRALRAHFSRGTVYTRHDAASIAAAIVDALDRRDALAHDMRTLAPRLQREWDDAAGLLLDRLRKDA